MTLCASTAILYKLKLDQSVTTIPTVGFNVESFTYKKVKFNVWVSDRPCNAESCAHLNAHQLQDVGGQDKIRPLWRHYYTGTQGLVFVVDSNDRDRIDEARQELHRILSDREMKDCLLLVFANKQDIQGGEQRLAMRVRHRAEVDALPAMTPTEVTEKLGLLRMKDRFWYCHPSNALEGEGLLEGLRWLSENIKK